MTQRVQDWINAYIDSLLGERKSSSIAGEAATEEEALLAGEARRLKFQAREARIEPRREFVASLEKELRRELAEARPVVRPIPFWRRSWRPALGGLAAAAAVLMLFFWARSSAILPLPPAAAPAAAPQVRAPAILASPPPQAAGAAPAAPPAAAPRPEDLTGAAPVAPPAAAQPASRSLVGVVGEAQSIFLGRVEEVSAPAAPPAGGAFGGAAEAQVVISVERFLKGPLPGNRVALRASPGSTFSKGERVLVMARDVNGDGVLDVLDYPRTKSPEGAGRQEAPGAADTKRFEAQRILTLEELVREVEGILRQQ